MGVHITQTCDRCKASRAIPASDDYNRKMGGWRELNSGSLVATVCSTCIRQLILSWRGRGESEET